MTGYVAESVEDYEQLLPWNIGTTSVK